MGVVAKFEVYVQFIQYQNPRCSNTLQRNIVVRIYVYYHVSGCCWVRVVPWTLHAHACYLHYTSAICPPIIPDGLCCRHRSEFTPVKPCIADISSSV